MPLILKDRVQETSTTTGTGTLTLAGAVTQFQTFSAAVGNGNTTYYTIYNAGGSQWEVGLGTVGAGTLARTTVLASSNAGAAVNFTGTLYVFGDYPADKAVYQDANGEITGTTINANTKFVAPDYYAQSILGGNLRTYTGTALVNWDGGGSGNVTFNGGISANPANKNISLSPTGTGSVTINPATAGSMNNVVIGATTAVAGSFTNLSVTGTTSFDGAQGTAGQVLTSAGTGNTPTWSNVTASTATNLANGALGSVPYQLLSGTTTFLAGNTTTTPQFITSTGVAGIATAPTLTGSTGSGNVVLATSPTLVTPALGTPASGTLTNCTFPTLNQNTTGTAGGIFVTAGWAITPSGTKLNFIYNGVTVASLDSSGNFIAKANVTAYGTP